MSAPWTWPPAPAGATGPAGPPGPAGPTGADGATGAGGAPGSDGLDGEDGAPGPAGAPGATGADGAAGPPGSDGLDGEDGAPGPAGPAGARGAAGATGAAGPPGSDGLDGEDGAPGPAGAQGPAGATGAAGPPGADGADGEDGAPGPAGAQGPAGPAGAAGPLADVFATDDLDPERGVGAFGGTQQSQAIVGGPSPVQAAASAYTVPSNVLTTIPGVSFPLLANRTYVFYFDGEMSSSNALGATINFASTYSGSVSRFLQAGILGSGGGTFDNPVNNSNGGEITASVSALTTGNWPYRIHGLLDTTSAGNLTLQVRRNNATVNVQLQGWVRQAN